MPKTAEERQQLLSIAERYHWWKEEHPGLSDIRILNRLHSEGFDIKTEQMLEAVEFAHMAGTSVPDNGEMNTREAAAYLGLLEDTFKTWYLPSYARNVVIPKPEGAPEPVRLNPNERGKPARFTSESIFALKEWLDQHNPDRYTLKGKKR